LIAFISKNAYSQESIPWFDIYDADMAENAFQSKSGDCIVEKDGFDKALNTNVKKLKSRQWFMHTLPEFKKWMGSKYLVESSAHVYKADKSTFLIVDFKINSENARETYGRLDFRAKMKCVLSNGESIYLENIERDKGRVNRNRDFTLYQGVFAIENYKIKTLKKHQIVRIGLIWEEGYQEYNIQNSSLVQYQLACIN